MPIKSNLPEKKIEEFVEENKVDIKKFIRMEKYLRLEKKSFFFFWKLWVVLTFYQIVFEYHFLIMVFILVTYTIFARTQLNKIIKQHKKKEYDDLEKLCEVPKGQWER